MARYTRLDAESLEEALRGREAWELIDGKMHREFKFKNFSQAFGFMTRVAFEAHCLDHHPEWSNVYSRVNIHLVTHDADGITSLDIELAERIDNLYAGK